MAFNYAESVTGAVYMPEADLNSPERKPPLLHSVPAAVVCDGAAVLRLLHILWRGIIFYRHGTYISRHGLQG